IRSLVNPFAAALGLRSSTPEGVYLYRVVHDAELAITIATNGLAPDPHNYGKGTWLNIEDARWYAESPITKGMNRTILEMMVSPASLGLGTPVVDAGHPFIHFRNEVLPVLNSDIRRQGGIRVRESYRHDQ